MSENTATAPVPERSGVQDGTGTGNGPAPRNLGIALALISMAQLMVVLDGTIVNIALPHLQKDLGFSNATLPWVVNAYALAFGGLLLLGGRIGDIVGRRKVFMFGVVLFGAASFIGGIAESESVLLISRVLQGVGAAAAAPNALALITTTFPAGKERNRAMAVYAAMSGAGAAVGLILGGALTEASWRWTFFINTPIGLVVAVLAVRYLVESPRQTGKFDIPGAIFGTLGLTSLVYGLTHAAESGWSDFWTVFFIAAGLVMLAIFLLIEANSKHALMPFRILANRTRGVSFLVMLAVGAAIFSMFYFLGIFIQAILGYSALKTGFAFLPFSFGIVVAAQISSVLIARMDPRWLSGFGAGLAAVGMFGFSRLEIDSTYLTDLLPFILLLSMGMGFIFVPLTLTAVHGVADEDSGVGSAVLNTVQQIGGAIGLATLGTVSTTAIKDKMGEFGPQLQQAAADGATPEKLKQLELQFTGIATTYGFTRAFLVSAAIMLGSAAVVLFGLAVKHQELANDGKTSVHVG
ncbi:MFS transporter [Kribbella sp. NBC_01245]|uniref:MFS transporter n=1 Tax=Kribbella sp. NBC_01245 TaxID=2903578 RepID=UPI002E2E1F9D|nr:MFS transporter [Kribbella sp. NBC_01245]